MRQALPADAFTYYVGLAPVRSYQMVADHFDVAKRTVLRTAKRENWKARLAAIEAEVRAATDKALIEQLSEMRERHWKMLRAMASRAAKAMSEHPLETGMDGIRAAKLVIEMERLMAAQSTSTEDDEGENLPTIIIS